jgi:hypothetical protein
MKFSDGWDFQIGNLKHAGGYPEEVKRLEYLKKLYKSIENCKHDEFKISKESVNEFLEATYDVFTCCEYDGERKETEASLIKVLEELADNA